MQGVSFSFSVHDQSHDEAYQRSELIVPTSRTYPSHCFSPLKDVRFPIATSFCQEQSHDWMWLVFKNGL
jgi:hypothetical protein